MAKNTVSRRSFLRQGIGALGAATLAGMARGSAAKRPNIIVILADDMGYSDIGCYGGEIQTPNLNRLANNGIRFTQCYNAARCCPTRASLLTGLYPHQTGIGHMTSEDVNQRFDYGYEGYRGYLNRNCVTIAEALRPAGYHTLMAGKWHVGTFKGMWPLDRGFDKYYGIIRGASNYFKPAPDKLLMRGRTPIKPPEDFYATDNFTDAAIEFVEEAAESKDNPFFLYLAYTSPHWPLHAPAENVKKYRGKYKAGWDEIRKSRLRRMVEMGIIRPDWDLTDRDAPAWDTIRKEKQDEMDHRMSIYAAQVDRMDQNIGRLLETLEDKGVLDNTLILFLSDNGACAEGKMLGGGPKEMLGKPEGWVLSYGQAWANASNTPFKRYKHWVHEGGISTPLIAHWPEHIKDKGVLRHTPCHLIDIMATCVDAADARYPKEFNGQKILPMEGKSLLPVFGGKKLRRKALYWEHEGNRALREGKWKLVAAHKESWQLYDMEADRTEMHDLAGEQPKRLAKMTRAHEKWAERVHVRPWKPARPAGYTPEPFPYPKTYEELEQ